MCELCAQIRDELLETHRADCLVWGLPNPKPEDCDCWDGCDDSEDEDES
jgi:hypothetical protein